MFERRATILLRKKANSIFQFLLTVIPYGMQCPTRCVEICNAERKRKVCIPLYFYCFAYFLR